MQSSFYVISAILLVYLGSIESVYNTFTYDSDNDNNENCCLVRLNEKFCLAKPLTRSLLQVNKKCQRLGAYEKDLDYLNKIVRRLNVEATHEVGEKILVELKAPIDKNILQNELVCLSPKNNNINLEKCFVELAPQRHKKNKHKGSPKSNEKSANDTAEQVVVEEIPVEDGGISLYEISEPVRIHEGHGLAIHESYELNLTNFKASTEQQRQCWTWYRSLTKTLCSHPKRYKNTCVDMTHEREKCLEYLFQRNSDGDQQEAYSRSLTIGSKLSCEDSNKNMKFLGYHQHSKICFLTNLQISVQYTFTDYLSLSDSKKNKDVLEFIAKNEKLTNEFESDCRDKITLADIKKALEEEEKEAEAATAEVESAPDSLPPSPSPSQE